MPSDRFQIAAQRAAASYPTEVRSTLSPSERAAAIYRELRKLDAESVREPEQSEAPSTEAKGTGKSPSSRESAGEGLERTQRTLRTAERVQLPRPVPVPH
jgi:hypothetical protein